MRALYRFDNDRTREITRMRRRLSNKLTRQKSTIKRRKTRRRGSRERKRKIEDLKKHLNSSEGGKRKRITKRRSKRITKRRSKRKRRSN